MSDNDHAIALYILELLMHINGPVPIHILLSSLKASRATGFCAVNLEFLLSFSSGSEELENLAIFLRNFPSLFHIDADLVSPVAVGETVSQTNCQQHNFITCRPFIHEGQYNIPSTSATSFSFVNTTDGNPYISKSYNFMAEMEAAKFFQLYLLRRGGDKWVPVRSLAGHLSQASPVVRQCIGSQQNFYHFLRRHQHIFEVQGELVSLATNRKMPSPAASDVVCVYQRFAQRSTCSNNRRRRLGHRSGKAKNDDTRSVCSNCSFGQDSRSSYIQPKVPQPKVEVTLLGSQSACTTSNETTTIILSMVEYSAVMLLRRLLLRVGPRGTHPGFILRRLVRAPTDIREVVGWTRVELHEFLLKNKSFFELLPSSLPLYIQDDETQSSVNISTLQTSSNSSSDFLVRLSIEAKKLRIRLLPPEKNAKSESGLEDDKILNGKKGNIFHVAKLWGIIDLGQHEHVFFDKSIFRNVDDLLKHFQHGETVYFNAVLAARHSRAKWRATHVWKEDDQLILSTATPLENLSLLTGENDECYADTVSSCQPALEQDSGIGDSSTAPDSGASVSKAEFCIRRDSISKTVRSSRRYANAYGGPNDRRAWQRFAGESAVEMLPAEPKGPLLLDEATAVLETSGFDCGIEDDEERHSVLSIDDSDDIRYFDDDYEDGLQLFGLTNYLKPRSAQHDNRLHADASVGTETQSTSVGYAAGLASEVGNLSTVTDVLVTSTPRVLSETGGGLLGIDCPQPDRDDLGEELRPDEVRQSFDEGSSAAVRPSVLMLAATCRAEGEYSACSQLMHGVYSQQSH